VDRSLHPQWATLDLNEILAFPTALLVIDATNSVLSRNGAQADTKLWDRARRPGGPIENTQRLIAAARASAVHVIWFRYEYLRDHYPATPMDEVQYRYWLANRSFTDAQKRWEAALVDEMLALQAPEDFEIVYRSFGNVFLGTPLQPILTTLGVRTLLIGGYHLDECVEQAARTSRDFGFMPLVVGDCCLCVSRDDEPATLSRIDSHWAPVVSTTQIVSDGRLAFRPEEAAPGRGRRAV
jgi:ureidoacrylate peracid hydrolase